MCPSQSVPIRILAYLNAEAGPILTGITSRISRISTLSNADFLGVKVKVDKVEYRRPDPVKDDHRAAVTRPEVAAGW